MAKESQLIDTDGTEFSPITSAKTVYIEDDTKVDGFDTVYNKITAMNTSINDLSERVDNIGLKVQKGTFTKSNGTYTETITLSETINPDKSFVLLNGESGGTSGGYNSFITLTSLTSTTLTVQCSCYSNSKATFSWQVVTWTE